MDPHVLTYDTCSEPPRIIALLTDRQTGQSAIASAAKKRDAISAARARLSNLSPQLSFARAVEGEE